MQSDLAPVIMLLGLFLGLELGPALVRRDTPWVRLGGAAVGALPAAWLVGSGFGTSVSGVVVIALLWVSVFGAAVLVSSVLARRSPGGRGLTVGGRGFTVLAATGGGAFTALVLLTLAMSWGYQGILDYYWMDALYAMRLPVHPVGAFLTGGAVGVWIGLREVLPSRIGVRGEVMGAAAPIRATTPGSKV